MDVEGSTGRAGGWGRGDGRMDPDKLAYFGGALECQRSGAVGQLFLLDEAQIESHDGAVRHDRAGHRSCSSQNNNT